MMRGRYSRSRQSQPAAKLPAPAIQRKPVAVTEGAASDTVPSIVHEVLRSPGQPLDATTRAFMEPRFARDFSGVRLHSDAKAADSALAVNARAYTVGQHVVIGETGFQPNSGSAQGLLAHELAHTIQQDGATGPVAPSANAGAEREADRAADDVMASRPVAQPTPQGIGIARQFRSRNIGEMGNSDLLEEYLVVRSRVLEPADYPEREADQIYLRELEREVRFRGINVPVPQSTAEPGGVLRSGPRAVRAVRFVAPDFFGPTLELGETSITQTQPDPSAGFNFDTYLLNETTGKRIPAQHMGGTRYRVLMGTPECPGCHFGRGLEVDLHGEHFLMVLGPQLLAGVQTLGAAGRIPPSRQLPPGPPPPRQLPPGPAPPKQLPAGPPPPLQLPPGPAPPKQLPAGPTPVPPSRQLPAGAPARPPMPRPMPRPPLPAGMKNNSEFGKLMDWGNNSAQARARIQTLTRQELQRGGVTREIAEGWRDFYKNETLRNPKNPSAPGRVDLMQRAMDLLTGG